MRGKRGKFEIYSVAVARNGSNRVGIFLAQFFHLVESVLGGLNSLGRILHLSVFHYIVAEMIPLRERDVIVIGVAQRTNGNLGVVVKYHCGKHAEQHKRHNRKQYGKRQTHGLAFKTARAHFDRVANGKSRTYHLLFVRRILAHLGLTLGFAELAAAKVARNIVHLFARRGDYRAALVFA